MENKKKISVDLSIYSESDLIDTIEILSNKFIIELSKKGKEAILVVSSKFSDPINENFRELLFDNLNDQKIRNRANNQTQLSRDLIIGKALYETGSFDNESELFMKDKSELDFIKDKKHISRLFK